MKLKKVIAILAVAMLTLNLFGCSSTKREHTATVSQTLTITGDVEIELELVSFGDFESKNIDLDNENVPSIELASLIAAAVPVGIGISIFLTSPDGVMAEISIDELDEQCRLVLTEKNGWQFVSKNHPPQAGIKLIDKIVVCAQEMLPEQRCLRIIEGESEATLSFGQLFNADARLVSVLEGQAKKGKNSTNAFTRRELIPISNYTTKAGSAIGYFEDGSQQQIDLAGFFEWRGNSADYIAADCKSRIKGIIGVWVDAPIMAVTDIRKSVEHAEKIGKVLVVELDGVGYQALTAYTPEFLSSKLVEPIRTVMPSISNVALAAIVTGTTPDINGITERKMRELNYDDMFVNKNCAVVEGESQLITMSVEQTLNPDKNSNGSTDDEVFLSAQEAISLGHELIYVHFHGFDDVAHTYGVSDDKSKTKLFEIDKYVKALSESFSGTVIITADHGHHELKSSEKIGGHGEFKYSDMTVPYIIFEV